MKRETDKDRDRERGIERERGRENETALPALRFPSNILMTKGRWRWIHEAGLYEEMLRQNVFHNPI